MRLAQRFAVIGLLFAVAGACFAQPRFPDRLVTIIVPVSVGTGPDIVARIAGPKLSERLGEAVVVDNKPAASGLVGTEMAARATPDGHTLLMAPTSFVLQAALLGKKARYDIFQDFVPICLIATGSLALAVSDSTPARNVKELVALAKAQPGALHYGSSGNGSPQHLAMELFKLDAGIDLVHVPYKETASANRDLMVGVINTMIMTVSSIVPLMPSGRIRVLANLGDVPSPIFANMPTLKEEGYPSTAVGVWVALLAPASTPAHVVEKLNAEMNGILRAADVAAAITKQGLVVQGGRPEKLAQVIKSDFERWTQAVAAAKIKVD